jgi:hypothetical protein
MVAKPCCCLLTEGAHRFGGLTVRWGAAYLLSLRRARRGSRTMALAGALSLMHAIGRRCRQPEPSPTRAGLLGVLYRANQMTYELRCARSRVEQGVPVGALAGIRRRLRSARRSQDCRVADRYHGGPQALRSSGW